MKDSSKTKPELIEEISALKQRIKELEQLQSEYKGAEGALRLREQHLASYIECAGDAIYILQVGTGGIVHVNSQACHDLGYSRDELVKLSASDIESSLSSGEVDMIHHDLKSGEVKTVEGMHKRKDGSIFPVEIRLSLLSPAQWELIIAIARDITKRKQAEEEIGRMVLMLDIAPNSITVHDFDGFFLYANQKTFDLHGFTRDEFLALNLQQLDVPDSKELIASRMQKLLSSGEATFEVSHYRKDGSTMPMEVSAMVTSWGDKKVILSIATEITERKRIEEELLRFRKLESLCIFADGIAHDFNNLMAIVQGCVDLALKDLSPDHISRQPLLAAMISIKQTKDLTSRLSTYSRGGDPHREILDVAEIIRDVVKSTVKGTEIRMKLDFSENLWPAEVDELQMKQCFYNLISNSVAAMPEGGNLAIHMENVRISAREVFDLREGPYLKITFTDDGVGIPEDHFSQIFDPYFTTKKMPSQKGLGLGLSVCYSVLKNHGGHATVKSQPGKGTSFVLYLPALLDPEKRRSN